MNKIFQIILGYEKSNSALCSVVLLTFTALIISCAEPQTPLTVQDKDINGNPTNGFTLGVINGDINLDGTVDYSDYEIMMANFGQQGDWSKGDLDGDGMISFGDYMILEANFGGAHMILMGDFNSDGQVDGKDIDLLSAELGGSQFQEFDLTRDLLVDEADKHALVLEIIGTFYGDANLDGSVDYSDYEIMMANWDQKGGWSKGDFDGDGMISFGDYMILEANFGDVR